MLLVGPPASSNEINMGFITGGALPQVMRVNMGYGLLQRAFD
jgi:hypothetical protein